MNLVDEYFTGNVAHGHQLRFDCKKVKFKLTSHLSSLVYHFQTIEREVQVYSIYILVQTSII